MALTLFVVQQLVAGRLAGRQAERVASRGGKNMPHLCEEHLKNFTAPNEATTRTSKKQRI